MIATVLKHYLYDICIGFFFDVVGSNFATATVSYVGGYWMAVDADDNTVVAYGKCTEQTGSLIVLDDGESEFIVHVDLFRMHTITKYEIDLLNRIADDEEYED